MRLILASQSAARQDMLRNAGLEFETRPAHLDEAAFMKSDRTPADVAALLAREKALSVSAQNKTALVIGADQVLECEDRILSKAATQEAAREKLRALSGKTHRLISAAAVVQGEKLLWEGAAQAALTMRTLDENALERYCARAGDALTGCVGAYALESVGVQLFETIRGDYFTILGLPLLPLLKYLREEQGAGL